MAAAVLLDIAYGLGAVAMTPWAVYRMVAQKRYRQGWGERLGGAPRREGSKQCIWIHAVSMGEINAIATLVADVERELGEVEIVISSTTDTGMNRARQLYGGKHVVFYFPWDFSWAVSRALGRVKPDLCIMMEGEVWPNFTTMAQRRSIPVMVANGRVGGGKGWPRYKRFAKLVRPMFRRLALVLAQDETHAERFRYLGVPADRVRVAGTLKYDTAEVTDKVAGSDELGEQLGLEAGELVWVAGQTGPGEEQIVLGCFEQLRQVAGLEGLRLVIVPRKPERFDEVARLIEGRGHELVRYSGIKDGTSRVADDRAEAVILGDTMGDLRKFYSWARVAFVGRSLVAMGGSDVLEVAGLGKAVVVGPHTENFAEAVRLLAGAGGIEVVADEHELLTVVRRLLLDRTAATTMGNWARQVVVENRGATGRTVAAVREMMNRQ